MIRTPVKLLAAAVLVLLVLGATVQAGPVETGVRWLLDKVAETLPGSFTYGEVQAALGDPVIVRDVRYTDGATEVRIARFELDLDLGALLRRTARIRLLRLEGVEALAGPRADPAPEGEPGPVLLPDIRLPVAIDIRMAEIVDFRLLDEARRTTAVVDRAELVLRSEGEALHVERLAVALPQGRVALAGAVTPLGDYPLEFALDWVWDDPPRFSGQGEAHLHGTVPALAIRHRSSGDLVSDLTAAVDGLPGPPAWSLQADLALADLGPVQPELAGVDLRASVRSDGSLDGYRGQAQVDTGSIPDLGPLHARVDFEGDPARFRLHALDVRTTGELRLQASAGIDLDTGAIAADGHWQGLAWPLAGEPRATSERGHLRAQGTLDDFRAEVAAQVYTPETGSLEVTSRADGGRERVFLRTLHLTGSEGLQLTARGEVEPEARRGELQGEWQALRWPLTGPAEVRSPQGRFTASGSVEAYRARIDGLLLDPSGNPVTAELALHGDTAGLDVEKLRLAGVDGGPRLEGVARVRFEPLAVSADAHWEDLAWPMSGAPRVTSPEGRLKLAGDLQAFTLDAAAALQGADFGTLQARLQAAGSERQVNVSTLQLRGSEGLEVYAEGEILPRDMKADLALRWSALRWPLAGEALVSSPQGSMDFRGGVDDFTARLDAALSAPDGGMLQATARARGDTRNIVLEPLRLTDPDGDTELEVVARLAPETLQFDGHGRWRALAWPLSGPARVASPEGQFEAAGTPDDYRFGLQLTALGPDLPEGRWRLEGRGNTHAAGPVQLNGEVLGGHVAATLDASWSPQPRWHGALELENIDPGQHWPEAPGSISLQARTHGQMNDVLEAWMVIEHLSGTLREQTLEGGLEAHLRGEDLDLARLDLEIGPARVAASGTLAREWALDWNVAIPALGALLPDAAGAIQGSGQVRGPRSLPAVAAELEGTGLAIAGTRVSRAQLSTAVDSAPQAESTVVLQATGIEQGGARFDRLRVDGTGTPAAHRATLALDGAPARVALAFQGALEDGAWDGRIERLEVLGTVAGDWRLAAPVTVNAGAAHARMAPALCLASGPARLCADGQWSAADGTAATLALSALDLARFSRFLPPDTTVDNRLDADLALAVDSAGRPSGSADVRVSPGRVTTLVAGELVELDVAGADLTGRLEPGQASLESGIDFGAPGALRLQAQVAEPLGSAALSGSLRGAITDFAPLAPLVPEVEDLRGNLAVDLTLGGSVPSPVLGGRVDLRDGGGEVPVLNIQVEDVGLAAVSRDDGSLQLSGGARSGPGFITLDGVLEPAAARLGLTLAGERFQVIDTPEVQVQVSPDLVISADPAEARVEGSVLIPFAWLSPGGPRGPGVVPVSADVVVVNDPDEPPPPLDPTRNLFLRVEVRLGDDVRVAAGGFEGRLLGGLIVEQSPQLPPRGTGTIEVASGEYRVYGQRLNLDRGRVLYSGGPLDNPGLDMQASRTVGEVLAGVQIRGSARQPRLTLYSQPPMPDASVLSYLVLGRPPDARSGSESGLLLRAVGAMGQRGGEALADDLESATGLDYIGFEEGEALADTALVIGKYLTPDLYISYGVGLFDAANTFNVRYRLSRRLTLQSSTSAAATGADLLYEIER